jgi:hypothetical protein
MTPIDPADRALCALTADLLRASGLLAWWGLALGGIASLALAVAHPPPAPGLLLALTALLALPERYLALRVRLDARLFARLADGTLESVELMDHALTRLRLRPAAAAPRPIADRALGARRLMLRHGALTVVQTLAFFTAIILI